MNSSSYLTEITPEFSDEPERDFCDRCGKNAWEKGMPSWTCKQELFCSDCMGKK